VKVRDRLRQMLEEDQKCEPADRQHRLLIRTDFDGLCDKVGGISDKEALLDFLHHNGVMFYRPGLFGGRIILDQNWAMEAIYALFDRKKALPLLHGYGRFSRADLEVLPIWRDRTTDKPKYTPAEQKVLLGMMESCGICFRVRKISATNGSTSPPNFCPNGQTLRSSCWVGFALILRTRRRLRVTLFFTMGFCATIFPNSASKPKTRPFTGSTATGSTSRKHAAKC
jgi:hypothetical protein